MANLGNLDPVNGYMGAEAMHRFMWYGILFPNGNPVSLSVLDSLRDSDLYFGSSAIRDHGIAATVANFRGKVNQELLRGMRKILAPLLVEPE